MTDLDHTRSSETDASSTSVPAPDSSTVGTSELSSEILAVERRNLFTLSAHYVSLRLGWIFKTETVIMPAFMDAISGAGWLRGCLPVVNRISSSLPPLFYAPHLKAAPKKKTLLSLATLSMAIPFCLLAVTWLVVWQPDSSTVSNLPGWLPALFLACYGIVFVATGLQRLAWATLQGKLIRANRRGRLMAISGLVGSVISVTAVLLLIPDWLNRPDGGFAWIFLMTAAGFVVAGGLAACVSEPADLPESDKGPDRGPGKDGEQTTSPGRRPIELLLDAWDLFRSNRPFRRIACVAMLFISIQLAFPHFQTLGRTTLSDAQREQGSYLMHWLVAQNIGFGVGTLLLGSLADLCGNRLAIRIEIFLLASVPLLALLPAEAYGGHYWIIFSLLGLTPLTFRTISNYVLELAPPSEHPRYIATLNLAMIVPFFASPAVGWTIDEFGFEAVFISIAVLVTCGGLLTFTMAEPRRNEHLQESTPFESNSNVDSKRD
jgi:MFS family permease